MRARVRGRDRERSLVGRSRASAIGVLELAAELVPRVGVLRGRERAHRARALARALEVEHELARLGAPLPTRIAHDQLSRGRGEAELAQVALGRQRRAQAQQRAVEPTRALLIAAQLAHLAQEGELAEAEAQLAALAALRRDQARARERAARATPGRR